MPHKFRVVILTIFLLLLLFFFSEKTVIEFGYWAYFIQIVYISIIIFKYNNNYLFLLSPSYITLIYLNLNFFLGHYVVSRGIGFDLKYYRAMLDYESVTFITAYFLICNLIVFLSLPITKFKAAGNLPNVFQGSKQIMKVYFLLALLFVLGFVKIDLSFIGGQGDFSYVFQLSISIIIVLMISDLTNKIKYLYYLLMVFLFIITNYDSKREILYIVILIIFFEFVKKSVDVKFRFKQIALILIGCFCLFYIIIVSSIMRGYGNFNVDNPIDASKYIFKYVTSDYASNALAANFELSTVYGNTSNAVNYVYEGKVELEYGSTFAKVLFLPIPRSIFPNKPSSMIDIYTAKFAPDFRSRGGSYPVSIYGESFWNFNLLAIPFLFLIFSIFNRFYLKAILIIKSNKITSYSVFLIYMYVTLIQFVRGSGFELWLLYALLSVPFSTLLLMLFKLKTKSNHST